MDIKETVEGLIKQAEHTAVMNTIMNVTTLTMDYNDEWEASVVVKRKSKKVG